MYTPVPAATPVPIAAVPKAAAPVPIVPKTPAPVPIGAEGGTVPAGRAAGPAIRGAAGLTGFGGNPKK